jgi:hypothetical protein
LLSAAALAGGLTLSLVASASAQQGPPPAPPPGANAGQGHHFDPAKMQARMEERRQHRQQLLHDALGIRPDQEAAWQAFVASRKPPEGERGPGMHRPGGPDQGQQPELTTPQRLDKLQARMAERQQRVGQRIDAIRRFYAALDPRQQKAFDALSHMERGGMGGFGRHHGHGAGWGGHGGPGDHMGRGEHGGPPGGPPPDGERGD